MIRTPGLGERLLALRRRLGPDRRTTTGTSRAVVDQLRAERQPRGRVEDDAERRACSRPGSRTVSRGSSTSTVPMPTTTASTSARIACTDVEAPAGW